MRKVTLLLTTVLLVINSFAQDEPKSAMRKLGANAVFIVDSQRIMKADLSKYSVNSIAAVNVLYDTAAIKLFGEVAKDGAVVIETRPFARDRFILFFRKSSTSFDSLYKTVGTDTGFTYILNDKVQNGNFEGSLSEIDGSSFIGIEILNEEQLISNYKVPGKHFGIVVRSKKPKDLYLAGENF